MHVALTIVISLILGIVAVQAAPPEVRIVGGKDTTIEKYPYVVSIRGSTNKPGCSGTITSHQFVLTAGHCAFGVLASQLSIQYGSAFVSPTGPNIVGVKRIIRHELYNNDEIHNDIALLQVQKPFVFDYVWLAPVRLPPMNFYTPQDEQGAPGTIVGWGMNSTFGTLQTWLQEVDLMIMPDKACLTKQWPIYKPSPIYNICAWEQGKGQCNADSGGPLFYDGMQVGIISWSYKPCTMTPYPGVYTRVASYVDWILHKQMLYD